MSKERGLKIKEDKLPEGVLLSLNKQWKELVDELLRLIGNKYISMADAHLVEMWDFLVENHNYIEQERHTGLCDTLNKICEILWSPEVVWNDFKPSTSNLKNFLLTQ